MLMKTSVYEKYASVNIIWHYVNSLHNTLELDNVAWQLPGRELSVVSPHHNSKVCNYYVELNWGWVLNFPDLLQHPDIINNHS